MRIGCIVKVGSIAVALLASSSPFAFDVHTHAAMTSEAVASSSLTRDPNVSALLKSLGLLDFTPEFGIRYQGFESYVDMGSTITRRTGKSIEAVVMDAIRDDVTTLVVPHNFTITGWFMRGAIREDDNTLETPTSDEPDGVFSRVFGHFFDPQIDRGLSTVYLRQQPRAVDWALLAGANVKPFPFGERENHYKIPDAREAMWRALTLKNYVLADDVYPANWGNGPTQKESLRKAYWATTFRALGDAVHLLQDMAQPQHTRNDAHSGLGCVLGSCAGGHDSYFEKYLRERTRGEKVVSIKEGINGPDTVTRIDIAPTQLDYQGYAKPAFANYGDYFATAVGGGNVGGRGLANYSNRGFYSFGTNIGSANAAQYPSPNPTGSGLGYDIISEPELKDSANRSLSGSAVFRIGTVVDTVTGVPEANVKLAAIGAWDQFLQQKDSRWGSYTLNYYNYDDQAKLLVPRAVAYSAGLIDYFFRGSIYVAPPPEGVYALVDHGDPASNCKDNCGFTKIKVRLANSTPAITPPGGEVTAQAMGSGMLVAVAKFRRNSCYTTELSGEYVADSQELPTEYYNRCVAAQPEEIVVSAPKVNTTLPACGAGTGSSCDTVAVPLTFTFPTQSPIPINAASLSLQIVFRGPLGAETDAVVVETVNVSEPTYFFYMNASDYIKLGTEAYTREEINAPGAGHLRATVRPTTCIVNDQLSESCAQSITSVDFTPSWGSTTPSTVITPLKLPVRSFSRLAMLVPPGMTGTVVHASSPCTPRDPVQVPERRLQEGIVIDTSLPPPPPPPPPAVPPPPTYRMDYTVDPSSGIARGIVGGAGVACVAFGDGMPVALPESAFARMSQFTAQERVAKPIQDFSVAN